MMNLLKSCNRRVITVATVIILVNMVLYGGSFMSLTIQDAGTSKSSELKEIFAARQHHLKDVCLMEGQKPPSSAAESIFPGRTIVETRHRILYCSVQKVGSTFWGKTLTAMNSQGSSTSQFKVKKNENYKLERYQNFKTSYKKNAHLKDWFMKRAVSFIVVRDPYTKLFSAFADKLYHPNYLFWKITGKPIEKMMKHHNGTVCGNNISFSDFIKYIISETKKGKKLNPHFTPIYEHCFPCKTKYDYIMKFENFRDDYHYIMDQWNTRFNLNMSLEILEKASAISIASKHIKISFSTSKLFSKPCNIPVYNFLLRTWRFLQITGLLPKEADLPFHRNITMSLVNRESFLLAVKEVLSREIDWAQVKKQRHEALVQAYQGIDRKDMQQLREIVKPDCNYFDYDETPDYLFQKNHVKFNYFDGINIS